MYTTAQQISKYFQESVSFDFKKGTISSFMQIQKEKESFYTLLDRDAFSALLNDCLYYDNQLEDIFRDIYDAQLGIQKFADIQARKGPRAIITYFLNQPKYQYHKKDIAKVYLAFNTWLEFFGEQSIRPEWSICPFCGNSVKNGVCINKTCKKSTSDCLSASAELAAMLEDEQSGRPTPTPNYWNLILENSEFYLEYKIEIETHRRARQNEILIQDEQKKKNIVDSAIKEVNLLTAQLDIEIGKEVPDFDSIIRALSENDKIKEALKYNDDVLSKKISSLKKAVTKKKKEFQTFQDAENKLKSFETALENFLEYVVILEQELVAELRSLSDVKMIFAEANKDYTVVATGLKNGYTIDNPNIINALKKYDSETRVEVSNYISRTEHEQKLLDKQKQLIIKVNMLLNMFNGVQPKDDKAKGIGDQFYQDIENNKAYDDFRVERKSQYDEIVNPIRVQLAELIKAENELKLLDFTSQSDDLIKQIDKALPQEGRAAVFQSSFEELKKRNYFSSIKTNGEYLRRLNIIKEKLAILAKQEKDYNSKMAEIKANKERKRRRVKKASLILSIILLVLSAATFVFELSGFLPANIVLAPIMREYSGEIEDGKVVITGTNQSEKNITIPAETRLNWQFSANTVLKIGNNAFLSNSTIETVTLPASIEEIGSMAFSDCSNLRRITLNSINPPKIESDTFTGSNIVFYVPINSYDAYLQDDKWSVYANSIFPDFGNDLIHATILFDENGGEVVEDIQSHQINTLCNSLPTPTRFGYKFVGWYYTINEAEYLFDSKQMLLPESLKLKARWEIGHYIISFDYANGSGPIDDVTVAFNEEFGELPEASREGYTFDGWYLNDTKITATSIVNISGDCTAIARWTPNLYTVSFNYNGGEISTESKHLLFDSVYGDLPITSKEGYMFDGWYLGDSKIESSDMVYTSANHTLIAKWTPIQYKLSYQLNGGTFDIKETQCVYDESYLISEPFRLGYSFDGWGYDGHKYYSGDSITNLTSLNGDILIFVACWIPNNNQIVYDSNGGGGTMSATVVATDALINLPKNQFEKAGYIFKGWSTSSNGIVEYYDEAIYTMGTQSTNILYAVWEPVSNKLILNNVIDGSIVDKKDIIAKTDENIELLNPFVRQGYTLIGWSDELDGSLKYSDSIWFTMVSNDINLYTIWEANSNTVLFDANQGVGDMHSQIILTDSIASLSINTFTRTGFTFLGWSTTSNGEVEYLDGAEYTMGTSSSYTLYAVWEKDSFEILYALNGGTNNELNPINYSVDSDEIVLQSPVKAGYQFVNWCSDEALTSVATSIPTGSTGQKVFYAKWVANTNILHFDSNGGNGTMEDVQMLTDSTHSLPSNKFTREGYTFVGWKKSADVNEGATYSDASSYTMGVEPSYTLYAVWSLNLYTINYELNGGVNSSSNPMNYTVESDDIVLVAPNRLGYSFVAWCQDASLTRETSSIQQGSTGNITLYAKWQANINTLHFYANGGMGSMDSIQIATGDVQSLPNNLFTRNGYTFIGWKISNDENEGASYVNNESYVMGTASECTLYAVWSLNTYYITYELNGGINNSLNPISYTVESNTIELNAPTRSGYSFVTWCTDLALTNDVLTLEKGSVGNRKFYAKWIANTNTLHFDANGGIGVMDDEQISTGATIVLPANVFYKEGSKFAGWSTSQGGTSLYSDQAAFTMGTKNEITLYAVWSQTQFIIQYNLNGGTNSTANPSGYNSEAATIVLANPTKTGNTFVGWYTDSSYTNKISSIITGSSGDYNLYAKWSKNTYTVYFDYNGGSGSTSTKTVTYDEAYGSLPTATRTGYTYAWYYGNTLITETTTVNVASAHTLTAKWTPIDYILYINENNVNVTVIRNDTGKEVSSGSKVPYGTSLSISCSTNSGYHDGWCDYNGQTITMPNSNLTINSGATKDSSCIIKGTPMLLADGSSIAIENITIGDRILSFNHSTGQYVETEVVYTYYAFDLSTVISLNFANNIKLEMVNAHGLFDATLNKYVLITQRNVSQFIGHQFAYATVENGVLVNKNITLYGYDITERYVERYDIVTKQNLNHIANGLLACSDTLVGFSNTFEFENMVYNIELMEADILLYGLFEYQEWSNFVSYEEFVAFNGAYFKVAIGKGLLTEENLFSLINDLRVMWES